MARFKTLIFWFGGVLTEELSDLVLSFMMPGTRGQDYIRYRKMIEPYTSALICGDLESPVYCQHIVHELESKIDSNELEDNLLKRIHLRSEVANIIREIPEEYPRWLVSDYPLKWYEVVSNSLDSSKLFPSNRVIFTAEIKSNGDCEIYDQLPVLVGQPMANCIMVDGDSSRAVRTVRRGLASIIYVYPHRLKHELALQKILQVSPEVMHPKNSERVVFS